MPSRSSDLWVLALDIGTSSSRAIVYDAAGCAVKGLKEQRAYEPRTNSDGTSEFDADFLVEQTALCIDGVLAKAGRAARRIQAVGACTFWHSMVGVDRSGRPTTPVITWADTRSASAARRLKAQLESHTLHARTGCAIHPSYYPARLLWLSESDSATFRQVDRWLSPGEYLYLRLFGDARCSVSIASATGLFNQNACDWDEEMLDHLPIVRKNLAPLTDLNESHSGLAPAWANRWPALAQIPWAPAIGDGAASNLGSGCDTDRRIAINLGTSGAIRVLWEADHVEIPDQLWCYRLDRQHPVMGGAFSDGGVVYPWLCDTLKLPPDAEVEKALIEREPDCHGLTFLPFLSGERSIGWRPEARATLHGLSLATTSLDITQACMEAVSLRYMLVADVLRRQFPNAKEIVVSGGVIRKSPAWTRMLVDALGVPITISSESEASSRGVALVALEAAGVLQYEEAPRPGGHVVQPDMSRHEQYLAALARQQALYERLLDFEESRV
jgi:gluconokinase